MFKRFNERCSEPAKSYAKSVVASYRVIDTSRQMSNGVLSKSTNVRVVDPEQLFSGASALDLSLENLIAIGADLKPQTARLSELAHAVNADRQVEKAENFMSNLPKSE